MSVTGREEPWLDLYNYWLDRHVAGKPPRRADLDPPIEIPRLIGRLMLIEVLGDEFRYRLIGSLIASAMNMDVTGKMVGSTGWASPEIAAAWRQIMVAVRAQQKALLVITSLPGDDVAHNHCIALPLVDAAGQVEQIMVGVYYGGYARRNPVIEGLTIHEINPAAPRFLRPSLA